MLTDSLKERISNHLNPVEFKVILLEGTPREHTEGVTCESYGIVYHRPFNVTLQLPCSYKSIRLDAQLVHAASLGEVIGQGNDNVFEYETQVVSQRGDQIIAKCIINVLSSHYSKSYFRVRFRFTVGTYVSPETYTAPIHVVSKASLTSGKKTPKSKQGQSNSPPLFLPPAPILQHPVTPTPASSIFAETPMPAHVVPSEHVRMIEMLRNLQKGQDEHKRQLDEILSKKRNFSEFSADNCSEEDVEAAFESAFRLLKKYKNTNSGSAQNPEKKNSQNSTEILG